MNRLFLITLLVTLLFSPAVSSADPVLFKMEGGNMSKTDTYVDPVWDTIALSHVYDSPLVFIIPRNDGGHPADFRIRNITPSSFEATVVEPPGYDGPHIAMTVSYIVAEEGNWFLTPDRFMTVGAVDVSDLVNSQGGSWVTVPIPQGYTNPIVLAQIQGFANELNNLPSEFSIPWVTASVRNVTATSFQVSLDGGRCTNVTTHADPDCVGPYTLAPERIAYLVIEGNVQDSFVDADGKTILLETIQTGSNIFGWSDGGTYVSFSTAFTQAPLFVAKPQTRNEPDGGWFRFSGLSAAGMTLLVEEALGDSGARYHNSPGETGGVLAFSENFRVEDLDPDKDLVPIPYDNCPFVANDTQADVDGDGVGDACDCGDGIRAYTEVCDDGNLVDGDGCDSSCAAEPGWICLGSPSVCDGMCGDGMVIGSELCDDGNITDDPECHSDCQSFCGDGVRDFNHGESCDGAQMGIHTCLTLGYGFTGGVLACSATCAYDTSGCTTCGDGVAAGDELCDDGNLATGDGCNAYCTPEQGWDCTDPHNCVPVCGDGLVKGDELCDDGNLADGDGCSALCIPESGWDCADPANCVPLCGDGVLTGPELCDDGNTDAGDGCSPTCSPESGYDCVTVPGSCSPICGDGILVVEEACDDGNLVNGDGCDDTCSWEEGFDCTGNDCVAICGDGMVLGSEGCDDGNLDTGDGCDDTCVEESGWSCTGEPSTCAQTCGDGVLQEGEACDDGNLSGGDGCADNCNVENGWVCEGEPSLCEELQTPCGDGALDEGEGCDDGNLTDGDGCAADCTVEAGWICPDGGSCCADEDNDGECDDGGLGTAGSGCTCQAARRSEPPAAALTLLLLFGLLAFRRTLRVTGHRR